MPSDPNTKIPLSESLDNEIDRLLSAGLENFSVRELLGMMLSAAGQAERSAYLAETTGDKGNGSYDRSLNVGSIPVDIRVPRTRSGQFRPNSLPPAYERGYSEALLHGPEQIADLPVPVAESPGAVRIGHPERSHLVEYLAPNSVFNSLPRQRSSPHLRPDDRLVTIDRVLHHASLGVA